MGQVNFFRERQSMSVPASTQQYEQKRRYRIGIVESGKYKRRSPLGGLTKEQILTGPYVAIAHATPTSNFRKIMKEGWLQSRIERGRQGKKVAHSLAGNYMEWEETGAPPPMAQSARNLAQFPGIYTHLVTCWNDRWMSRGNVIFVFSLALLKQTNWHLNIKDS